MLPPKAHDLGLEMIECQLSATCEAGKASAYASLQQPLPCLLFSVLFWPFSDRFRLTKLPDPTFRVAGVEVSSVMRRRG